MPGNNLFITSFADSICGRSRLLLQALQQGHATEGLWFFGTIAIFIIVIAAPFLFIRWHEKYLRQKTFEQASAHFVLYDEWLSASNGYYKSLPRPLQQRFLQRVAWFMANKTFTCIDMPPEEKMSILISAAAVQISFGLDKYGLDFFDTIYIMQHNYQYGAYEQPFEGHVNGNGIYLSWDNFVRGFDNYTDADNVGIHEMAHALAYVNFMAGDNDGQDEAFIQRFYQFSAVARPIFEAMQKGEPTLLNAYAATNYNEFWAVAVETFFEQSLRMKVDMPILYEALCHLLNQDPLEPEKLLTISGYR